jgi:hypothetical protein
LRANRSTGRSRRIHAGSSHSATHDARRDFVLGSPKVARSGHSVDVEQLVRYLDSLLLTRIGV